MTTGTGVTPFGQSFIELDGSPRFALHDGKMTGTRVFQLEGYDSWPDFIAELYGSPQTNGTASTQPGVAVFPDIFTLAACDCAVEPFQNNPSTASDLTGLSRASSGGGGYGEGSMKYAAARVTVGYKSYISLLPGYPTVGGVTFPRLASGTLLDYSVESGVEFVSIPGRYLVYADGNVCPGDRNAGIPVTSDEFVLRWERALSPQWGVLESCKGCTNYGTFLGYNDGKVLFLGYTPKELMLPDGTLLWNITFRFKVRAIPQQTNSTDPTMQTTVGWNYDYRLKQDANAWVEIFNQKSDGTVGNPPFNKVDFSQLFLYAS